MEGNVLEISKLHAGYGGADVLSDINLSLESGKTAALIGPNGAGKSTLLKVIAGMVKARDGKILISGKDAAHLSALERAKHISIMLSATPDTEWMSVREIVENGRYPYTGRFGILSEEDDKKVEESLYLTDTEALKDRYFRTLSDGQKQRVMLARAIAQEPELMLLDEPTSFLDIKYKLEFMELIRELAGKKNISMLISLHELRLGEGLDRVFSLKDGRLAGEGEPRDIFKEEYIEELYDLKPGSYHGI